MLQQILRDLYVDPEILAELDEQQKQTLFCKMREEQVRRWKAWNDTENETIDGDSNSINNKTNDKKKKNVTFLKGIDGDDWVWVMGEHANDKTIEAILTEEAREKARMLAEKETKELRKQVEETLSEYIELTPKIDELNVSRLQIDDMDIYCSVDELREKINNNNNKTNNVNNYTLNHYQNNNNNNNHKKFNVIDTRDVLHGIAINNNKVSNRVALWEKRLTEERTCEILKNIQKKQMETDRETEEAEMKQEQLWMEQERKAKQAEQQIREIARKAREEHRLTCNLQLDAPYNAVAPGVPPARQSVIEWYLAKERPRRAGLDSTNNFETWFHGLITRLEAEKLLQDQLDGTFLVRLSERIWGYAISYKARDKCKHYLVNATDGYKFLGNNQLEHRTLGDLIAHHRQYPLSGGEKLLYSCPRKIDNAINELFNNTK